VNHHVQSAGSHNPRMKTSINSFKCAARFFRATGAISDFPRIGNFVVAAALVFASFASSVNAQEPVEVATDPVGFVKVDVPAQSDILTSIPFTRSSIYKGKIQAINGSQITVVENPNWSDNQFVFNATYSAFIVTGEKEGLFAKISSNTQNSIQLELEVGDSLSGINTVSEQDIQQADSIDIVPHWTLATLLSGNIPDGTEAFLYENSVPGKNHSPSLPLVYYQGYGWYETIGYTVQSDRALKFGAGMIIRNNTGSKLSTTMTGTVPMIKHRVILRTLTSNLAQDQTIGYFSPVPESLADVGLGAQNYDELYLFDREATGKNKSPSLPLVYFDGRWYNSLNYSDVTDSVILHPGDGMIYRKVATDAPTNFVWQSVQSYLSE